jgi:hypothetical protein
VVQDPQVFPYDGIVESYDSKSLEFHCVMKKIFQFLLKTETQITKNTTMEKYVTLGGMENIENFDALYRYNNDILLDMLCSHVDTNGGKRLDRITGTYIDYDGTFEIYKQVPFYKLPGEVVELCSYVDRVTKLHAYPIYTSLDDLRCAELARTDLDSFNHLEWLQFLYTDGGCFYVNCNPQSPHYGNILLSFIHTDEVYILAYNNIGKLLCDINKWMMITDVVPEFDAVFYFESIYQYYNVKRKDIFLEKYDNDGFIPVFRQNINREIRYAALYIKEEANDFVSYAFHRHPNFF